MPETHPQPDAKVRAARVRRRLLAWYDVHQRRLPWRAGPGEEPDPYHVLVSEAMLQQTQVATVIDYFERFIGELPTVRDLAGAKEQRVLRLWQGLGYYRRASAQTKRRALAVAGIGERVDSNVIDLKSRKDGGE